MADRFYITTSGILHFLMDRNISGAVCLYSNPDLANEACRALNKAHSRRDSFCDFLDDSECWTYYNMVACCISSATPPAIPKEVKAAPPAPIVDHSRTMF